MKHLAIILAALFGAASAQAATIAWSATPAAGPGFDMVNGTDLATGSLVRVGTFNISDTLIAQNFTNVAYLNQNFVEAATTTIGTPAVGNNPGHFTANSPGYANFATLAGRQIYFWAFASTNNADPINTATQIGIFYEPIGGNGAWAFPTDPSTGFTNVALVNLTSSSTAVRPEAKLVVGSFGPGVSLASGATNFTLQAVPEPTSGALIAACGIGAMLLRLRRFRRR